MLRPPPQLNVSQWAKRHRMLGSRTAAGSAGRGQCAAGCHGALLRD
jgi:hypothetical protein